MSEGTSLDDIESGNIREEADNSIMDAIMSDMNGTVEEHFTSPEIYTPAPEPQQQPPSYMYQPPPPIHQFSQQQQQQQQPSDYTFNASYERVEDPVISNNVPSASLPKKNSWADAFDFMRDPMIVGLLVSLFSLPALHTWLASRIKWAYKVGGSLSWLGFIIQFMIVAGIFAAWKYGVDMLGV